MLGAASRLVLQPRRDHLRGNQTRHYRQWASIRRRHCRSFSLTSTSC